MLTHESRKIEILFLFHHQLQTMFRISPSRKDITAPAAATADLATAVTVPDPLLLWTSQYNFTFPPPLSVHDANYMNDNTGIRVIHDVPRPNTSLYHLLSQYNPWLDCEMTREKRVYLKPRVRELCYPVYIGGGSADSSTFFRNETIIDIVNLYLWPLLHSRADEVVACGTYADWRRLFKRTICLAFPDYEYWVSVAAGLESVSSTFISISDQRRTARLLKYMTPARILYLLTTRANFWPYGASSSSAARIGGLCAIKPKIKEYNDKTEIDWLVGADFLRKMKRVHIYFTTSVAHASPLTNTLLHIDSDSE
jgi:hypothetical protein